MSFIHNQLIIYALYQREQKTQIHQSQPNNILSHPSKSLFKEWVWSFFYNWLEFKNHYHCGSSLRDVLDFFSLFTCKFSYSTVFEIILAISCLRADYEPQLIRTSRDVQFPMISTLCKSDGTYSSLNTFGVAPKPLHYTTSPKRRWRTRSNKNLILDFWDLQSSPPFLVIHCHSFG